MRDDDWWLAKASPEPNSGCHIWMGAVGSTKGYGNMKVGDKYTSPHRQRYIDANGPLPDKCQVRHKCGNKLCINDVHLVAGTQAENEQDKKRHGTFRHYAEYGPRVGGKLVPMQR